VTLSPYQNGSVTSADGTIVAYRQWGQGPGVILLHGALQASQNFTKLAEALSDAFTVYVPDRRGRGRSGPPGEGYGLASESADVDALLRKTGARRLFGLSSGAVIALQAALTIPGIDRLAVYEPPLVTERSDPTAWTPRYQRHLDRGELAAAMVAALKGTGDVSLLTRVPSFVLVPLLALAIRADAKRERGPDDVPIRALIPTIRFDVMLVREAAGMLASFGAIRSDVLLLGGNRSAPALRPALDALAALLPAARRVELDGIGHLAADNQGRPLEVARHLRSFFA
jgi:pimeloyl-ACP methyl ester carboxylesterase